MPVALLSDSIPQQTIVTEFTIRLYYCIYCISFSKRSVIPSYTFEVFNPWPNRKRCTVILLYGTAS